MRTSIPRSLQRREHALLAVLGLVDVRARGAEDRPAAMQDAARVLARQLDRVVRRARPSSRAGSRTARGRRCRSPCERFRG